VDATADGESLQREATEYVHEQLIGEIHQWLPVAFFGLGLEFACRRRRVLVVYIALFLRLRSRIGLKLELELFRTCKRAGYI
jgi:hypothetical protein